MIGKRNSSKHNKQKKNSKRMNEFAISRRMSYLLHILPFCRWSSRSLYILGKIILKDLFDSGCRYLTFDIGRRNVPFQVIAGDQRGANSQGNQAREEPGS